MSLRRSEVRFCIMLLSPLSTAVLILIVLIRMYVVQIAAADAGLKQANAEVVQITTELSSCFNESYEALSDQLIPSDTAQLDELIGNLQTKTTEAKTHAQQHSVELMARRNSLAAKEALISQNSSQLQQNKQKVAGLADKMTAVSDCIMQLGQILEDKLFLADLDRDNKRLDSSAGITTVIRVAQEMSEYATSMEAIAGANRTIAKKFKKFRADNPHVCPCCEQAMEAAAEGRYERNVEVYFDYERERLGDYKHRNDISNRCLKVLRRAQDLQGELGPQDNLRQEIARLEKQLQSLREEAVELRSQVEQGEAKQRSLDHAAAQYGKALHTLHSIHARWQAVGERLTEAQEKKKRLSQSIMMMQGQQSDNRTLDDVELSLRSLNEKKDSMQAQKERLVTEESALGRSLFSLKTLLSEAESNLERARGKGNKHKELEQDLNRMQVSLKEAHETKTKLVQERETLTQQQNERQLQVSQARAHLQQLQGNEEKKVSALRSDLNGFKMNLDSLHEVERDYDCSNLQEAVSRLSIVKVELQVKEDEIKSRRPQLEQIRSEITSQDRTKRNVQNNVALRDLRCECTSLQQQISEQRAHLAQQQHSAEDVMRAERRLEKLQQKRQQLMSDKDQLRGKLEIYNQQIAELKNKLNSQTYKGIEERHRRKTIEFETTNLAVGDLDTYHNALLVTIAGPNFLQLF